MTVRSAEDMLGQGAGSARAPGLHMFGRASPRPPEQPIRAELFSIERLEQHAESLARAQRVTSQPERGRRLANRLSDNTKVLNQTYRTIVHANSTRQPVTPAAEWLMDNFHIIDEQVREIKNDLPPGFYRRLPKLSDGPLQGYPRVFGVAWALIAHTDSGFDVQKLTRFVEAYQRIQPLTIGELWALAITLRITLVENLRRLAEAIVAKLSASQLADSLADGILGTSTTDPEPAPKTVHSLGQVPWSTAFAVELAKRLRDHDPNTTPALRWLSDRLSAEGTTTDKIVHNEFQSQSAMDVTVRNVITTMRLVSTMNWAEFFESISPVDAVLRAGSDFGLMDFQTRDLYRRAVEELARASGQEERIIAARAIAAANQARTDMAGIDPAMRRETDPGYYLIAKGRTEFEKTLRCKIPLGTRIFRGHSKIGVMSYVTMIACLTAIILALALSIISYAGLARWAVLLLGIVGLIPASDMAIAIINRVITKQVGGILLPGLELLGGVPLQLRTMIVMPTMLTDAASIQTHIERLEVHHLSNPDEHFTFGLLTDWCDSTTEHDPADETLLAVAAQGIARLNQLYGPAAGSPRFFLLHRRRAWNEGEAAWIGWERKRGKLHELNRLLRGAADTSFMDINGELPALPGGIRYVITLDADTRLPIGSAKRLVGKMAHPLNHPVFDPQTGIVVRGHAVLQPRVTPSLPMGSEGSLFQRAFSGPNGLDPYALAVSDVYQDLFEEGSFCGKGIYEIDAFEAALDGKIAENTVLSHDLLEGIFARAGLVTDIEVVEEFPSRYAVSAARQHRWVRGDWQLLPWVLGFPLKAHRRARLASLPLMGRWKLLDNLRRSLCAPAALLALLLGWFQPLRIAEIWTIYILLTLALPPFLPAITGIIPRRPNVTLRNHLRRLREDCALGMMQSGFLITFLAHQAWLMVDAVGLTLFRLFIRRRHLLEWVTSAQSKDDSEFDHRSLVIQIAASALCAVLFAIMLVILQAPDWPLAFPFLVLWSVSPWVAHWASLPPPAGDHLSVTPADALALRLVARRTWQYFETFITAEDNMLPPDNFQEDPRPVIAHRTSPTNLGLYLLAIIAARDFGWTGTYQTLDRLEASFASMAKLERFRGHFYNWYDTSDLRALEPKYVSSVDSGNLAGHLLALGNACRDIAQSPAGTENWFRGLGDTLELLRETAGTGTQTERALHTAILAFAATRGNTAITPKSAAQHLQEMLGAASTLLACAQACARERNHETPDERLIWAEALHKSVLAHLHDVQMLMPWAALLAAESLAEDDAALLLDHWPKLAALPAHCKAIMGWLSRPQCPVPRQNQPALIDALQASSLAAGLLMARLEHIAKLTNTMFHGMEFGFLFSPDRQLLSIGYRMDDNTLDDHFYDLLASEARLASFIAIAKGDLPAKHWFRLGRTLTPIDGGAGLMSWSGSMFEYLMPSLVMRAPAGSLLEQTSRLIVWRQQAYGNGLGVPWGMSESEYNARDSEQTYQYSSFGVPDLGYRRGLAESIVIAPYATGLAAMVDPTAAAANFRRLASIGARGLYGWYEALDYTPSRRPEGSKVEMIRAFMAHHQAMTIIAIANALLDGQMRARFHAEPIIRAAELLLQERTPRDVAVAIAPPEHAQSAAANAASTPGTQRHYSSAHSRVPRSHLLSNGQYAVMLTASGSGYSRWNGIAITRWREDVTCDPWGGYIFLRDVQSRAIWSAGYQPSAMEPDSYDVTFSEERAEIVRLDGAIATTLEIMVSPEDDAEVRRVSISNHGTATRDIELTSYFEIALARQADDVAHPAFAALFVQTEFVPEFGAILATRRRRSNADPLVWAGHLAVVEDESQDETQFETDRARFIGRGRTIRAPAAITDGWPLSNTEGAVLDPIFSLRRRVRVPRGATVSVAFWTFAAASREDVLALADKYHDRIAFERTKRLAWTQAQMQLRHLGMDTEEANLFQRLANHVLYANPALRPAPEIIMRGAGKASALWPQGISGDLPILLVLIEEDNHLDLVRQLLRAHEYFRLKLLAVDIVILNGRAASYVQDLQISLEALLRMNQSLPKLASDGSRGSVFILRADLVSAEIRTLLHSCARAVLDGQRGSLAEQINHARDLRPVGPPPARRKPPAQLSGPSPPKPGMEFFNGLGGFTNDGREYLTILEGDRRTPAPWLNVIANPSFGFQVSTDGSGFTWSVNSQQNQLTPWSNDPVCDRPGEAIYLRDDDTGELWGPTALPIREEATTYSIRHGQGYSRFDHLSHGIALELLQFVPVTDSIKISRLKITNNAARPRNLSITAYAEWVLGTSRAASAPFIFTELNAATNAIFARNPWNDKFGERVAFADLNGQQTSWTCDRTEFLGRDGAMDRPLGLSAGAKLSNRTGAGFDPCGALQTRITLPPYGTTEIVWFLGQAGSREAAEALVNTYRAADLDAVFAAVTRQWDDITGTVQVKTPDRALDILLNRWLPYQTLACRVWARTAFYQASGAYGFRDQLQDVMALCIARPDIAREHLLRAAGRQFIEGDVQHWWLPESGNGIRTRVSDDRGWLAYATAHYVQVTGDAGVLNELVPFLEGPVLQEGERDAFFAPQVSRHSASLFEHCALALDKSLQTGMHGLPLMGTGDWNDGMDQIGAGGKGESVWLGWFLYAALNAFADVTQGNHNTARAAAWRAHAAALKIALEQAGWDGDWYRRAFFDDGSPLGSVVNSECRIDSIAQSWSVISRAGSPQHTARAMGALDKYLVREDDKLSLLFTPPFNNPAHDPGYIKGYPAGIRENGGQYTHGAVWAALAQLMRGDGDRAGALLTMLNPIRHADSPSAMQRYKVEPYVACADVYSEAPHVGRGGWTWYTGSAGWLYRVALESALGFRVQGRQLRLDPCIPRHWPGFEITFRHRSARYEIAVENPHALCRGVIALTLDDQRLPNPASALIPLMDDGQTHRVRVRLG